MKINNSNNLHIKINENIICLLFSFNIFFWGVTFNIIELRFLIFLLFFQILYNFNKKIMLKYLKYLLISLTLLLHLYLQANTVLFRNFFSILGFFLILIILDIYKDIFFKHLNKIIFFFLIFFYLFIIFHFFFMMTILSRSQVIALVVLVS
jgi:hypothetical protein